MQLIKINFWNDLLNTNGDVIGVNNNFNYYWKNNNGVVVQLITSEVANMLGVNVFKVNELTNLVLGYKPQEAEEIEQAPPPLTQEQPANDEKPSKIKQKTKQADKVAETETNAPENA